VRILEATSHEARRAPHAPRFDAPGYQAKVLLPKHVFS
jgi:hypothetical protein